MGYYSSYEVIDTDFNLVELKDILGEYTNYPFSVYDGALRSSGTYKWYYWKDDLAKITADYPGKFIEIERIGEESPDMERGLAKDGMVTSVTPELIWPEY
jgi:hypothetical protein